MKRGAAIALISLVLGCVLLLWTSNDFEQTAQHKISGQSSSQSPAQNFSQLAMTFAHADHAKQQCVACHHNYQDGTGQGLCLACHRSEPAIASKMRTQFHDLCMGCHTEKRSEGEESGPLRSCKGCHTADHQP
jgi:hypothetical protein